MTAWGRHANCRVLRSALVVCSLTAGLLAVPVTAHAQIPVLCSESALVAAVNAANAAGGGGGNAPAHDTTIAAVTPPGPAGAMDVTVATTGGAATAAGAFTYTAGPGI